MNRTIVTLAMLTFVANATAAPAPTPAKLIVHTDKPGHAVSPTLYGIFFEGSTAPATAGSTRR